MELAAASPVRTAAANFGRRVHSTLEGLKVPHPRPDLKQECSLFKQIIQADLSRTWEDHLCSVLMPALDPALRSQTISIQAQIGASWCRLTGGCL